MIKLGIFKKKIFTEKNINMNMVLLIIFRHCFFIIFLNICLNFFDYDSNVLKAGEFAITTISILEVSCSGNRSYLVTSPTHRLDKVSVTGFTWALLLLIDWIRLV